MRPVLATIGGAEMALRLSLGDLDEVARAEPDFSRIGRAFAAGEIRWPVVRAILSCALRDAPGALKRFVEERGVIEAHGLAARLFAAAMTDEDEEEAAPGKAPAGAATEAAAGPSGSGPISAPAA